MASGSYGNEKMITVDAAGGVLQNAGRKSIARGFWAKNRKGTAGLTRSFSDDGYSVGWRITHGGQY
jgi:hypothetical protein